MKLGIMPYVIDSFDFIRYVFIVLAAMYAIYMSFVVVMMVVKFIKYMLTERRGGAKKCTNELRNSSST